MSNLQLQSIVNLAENARLKSGELSCLLEFINKAQLNYESSDDCPDYINPRSLGTIGTLAETYAGILNGINEDLAESLKLLQEGIRK